MIMLRHHSLRQTLPGPQQVTYSAKVSLSMVRMCACAVSLAAVLAGCGSASSSPTTTIAHQSTPTTATTTSHVEPTALSGPSYADSVTARSYTGPFRLTFTVALGKPATQAEDNPDSRYVKVITPISGNATIMNTGTGTSQNPNTSVLALYNIKSSVCGAADDERARTSTPKGELCWIEIAALAPSCSDYVGMLEEGHAATLALWAGGGDKVPNFAGPSGAICEEPDVHPSEILELKAVPAVAHSVVAELAKPPIYWVVVDDDQNCDGGDVLASKPAGLTGCLGPPAEA
jgi:hypothetical protein